MNTSFASHRQLARELAQEDGVLSTYLTQTNNPRELVVIVRDKDIRRRVDDKYRGRLNGLTIRVELSPKGFEEQGILAVTKEELPSTWWGWLVYYFRHYAFRILGTREQKTNPAPAGSFSPT
jgi:hypothetical protein